MVTETAIEGLKQYARKLVAMPNAQATPTPARAGNRAAGHRKLFGVQVGVSHPTLICDRHGTKLERMRIGEFEVPYCERCVIRTNLRPRPKSALGFVRS